MESKLEIAKNWLPRYTGMPLNQFGDYILVTNFKNYVEKFSQRFDVQIYGEGKAMQAATNEDGLTIINFGMGSPNAATIMDLLVAVKPKGVLFLGKCGGLKNSSEIGNFILPIAAIRGDGTSNDYFPLEVPALPSFKLHKFVSDIIIEKQGDYRTGVIFTTNRRVWEFDSKFKGYLKKIRAYSIDMETATLFTVGFHNKIPIGALLLVTDQPMIPEGVKTDINDDKNTKLYDKKHLLIGIESLKQIINNEDSVRHLKF